MPPSCPKCKEPVYFAERVFSKGKDWHKVCFKCENCSKPLTAGEHSQLDGKPYCNEAKCNAYVIKTS